MIEFNIKGSKGMKGRVFAQCRKIPPKEADLQSQTMFIMDIDVLELPIIESQLPIVVDDYGVALITTDNLIDFSRISNWKQIALTE